jgi:hypothetical protein
MHVQELPLLREIGILRKVKGKRIKAQETRHKEGTRDIA